MAKQIVRSVVWLSVKQPNIASRYSLVTALERLFEEIGDKNIDWDKFSIEYEMLSSFHPEGIIASIGFSVIVEDDSDSPDAE